MFSLLSSPACVDFDGEGVDRESRAACFVDCSLSVSWYSSLPLGLTVRVDGERVDRECRVDFLLSGGSAAVGGWLIERRHSKNRFLSGSSLITVAFCLSLGLFLFVFPSTLSGVFLSLGAILPAKFTGPDWPVRGSSFG